MTIGTRLRAIRKNAGLTQVKLAEMVGVSSQALNQWESDKYQPSRDNILKVADALQVSVADLLQPHVLPEQKSNGTVPNKHALGSGGRVVALIGHDDIRADDKFSIKKSIVTASYPCSCSAFAVELWDTSQEPGLPRGTIVLFDPAIEPSPGDHVIAMLGGVTISGIMSFSPDGGGNSVTIIRPLNPHWPPWRGDAETPIEIVAVKTETHLRG